MCSEWPGFGHHPALWKLRTSHASFAQRHQRGRVSAKLCSTGPQWMDHSFRWPISSMARCGTGPELGHCWSTPKNGVNHGGSIVRSKKLLTPKNMRKTAWPVQQSSQWHWDILFCVANMWICEKITYLWTHNRLFVLSATLDCQRDMIIVLMLEA